MEDQITGFQILTCSGFVASWEIYVQQKMKFRTFIFDSDFISQTIWSQNHLFFLS